MNTYDIDISNYQVDDTEVNTVQELSDLLRLPGVYEDGIETCEGVILAREVLGCKEATLKIDADQLALLKKVMNILIKRPHNPAMGQMSLGGKRYEEMIMRVFLLDKKE